MWLSGGVGRRAERLVPMYLYNTWTRHEDIQRHGTEFCGPGFTWEELHNAKKLEAWASAFTDPGEDFMEYRLVARSGETHVRRRAGY